jgi:hypothetical protein
MINFAELSQRLAPLVHGITQLIFISTTSLSKTGHALAVFSPTFNRLF